MNQFLKKKGWKPQVGFRSYKGAVLEDFIKLYGEKKGREEFKFFDDTIRNYFRKQTGGVDVMDNAQFIKEHTIPRYLIKLGKVPKEYVQRVRAATPLVNAVARHYQDKMINIVKMNKIILEVTDRETAIFLLRIIEEYLNENVDENETDKIIDTIAYSKEGSKIDNNTDQKEYNHFKRYKKSFENKNK